MTLWTFTSGVSDYDNAWIDVLGQQNLVFHVMACTNAHLALSSLPKKITILTYEMVIGDHNNTRTLLRDSIGGSILAQSVTPGILSCDQYRTFWLSWTIHSIRFGVGNHVGQQEYLTWIAPTVRHIASIGLTTSQGSAGQWVHGNINGQ